MLPRHRSEQRFRQRVLSRSSVASQKPGPAISPRQSPPAEKPRWKQVLKHTKANIGADNISILAAGAAFYLLLSIVPALAALISIYGLIFDPRQVEKQFQTLSGILPSAVSDILSNQMTRIASQTTTASIAAVISILIALWGASAAIKALITGLNVAYHEKEKRGFVKLTLTTLALTLGAVVAAVIVIAAVVALPLLFKAMGLDEKATLLSHLIRWPLLVFVAIVGLNVLYRIGPSHNDRKAKRVKAGAILAMTLWIIGSAAFAFYVSNFGKYNETYGSLGAIVITLTWLYLTAFVVLLGAELNFVLENRHLSSHLEQTNE